MNIEAFLRHHRMASNPFRGEEARQDAVFDRVEADCRHPDFEKILGDPAHPAAAVVFGERGSGKTALRLQLEAELASRDHEESPGRVLVVGHDEFNPMLGRIGRAMREADPDRVLSAVSLSDHLDVVLAHAVPGVVDAILDRGDRGRGLRRRIRSMTESDRRELQRLHVLYDEATHGRSRSSRLRKALRLRGRTRAGLAACGTIVLSMLALLWAVAVGAGWVKGPEETVGLPVLILLLVAVPMGAWWAWQVIGLRRRSARIARRLRAVEVPAGSVRARLREIPPGMLATVVPPETAAADEWRIERFEGLARGVRGLGLAGVVVLVDRIDEPVMVNGEASRMRALAWPLFRNKVLQMPGVGFKFLLPLELRDALARESTEFFREARLDKQNLLERLGWSGAMLFDLCQARMAACGDGDPPPRLMDLFDDSVSRQDVVDALDQMQQPRDAFKLLYGLVSEHCSNVVDEEESFEIGRVTLDLVRKRQVERKEGMLRGVRPG
ncbi:MAG: hypothetical protein VX726_10410 [Planctomycetota bacterium]|nr:hypothetical protein [Planctomycetota bacterium]